jgi:adenine-specific DNA-methyltransferase
VFTVAGDDRYKDGRRDLRLSVREHFAESVAVWDELVFEGAAPCAARQGDVFAVEGEYDLVYLDPPYVPRADDNCYVKRYHFLEGLACYWRGEACRLVPGSKVKKIEKRRTPFGSRRTALAAFEALFARFERSTVVLSYSSNGYPDLDVLVALLRRHKRDVRVEERDHRYHFGTHRNVARERAVVREYLIVGR